MPNLPFGLKLKFTLKIHDQFNSILKDVYDIITKIPEYKELKDDPEFLTLICCLVENMMGKNKLKIDKCDLVICIYDKLFSITDDEKDKLKPMIQYLWNNGKIKKQKYYKLAFHYVGDWVARKFL